MGRPPSMLNVLKIDKVSNEDGGIYFCFGWYKKKTKYFLAMGNLEVQGKITI